MWKVFKMVEDTTKQEPKYADTEYNRRLLAVADSYIKLQEHNIIKELSTLKEGARKLANDSGIPELKKICDEIEKISL